LAKVGYQGFLCSLIQPLFDHVDDQDGWLLGFQADEKRNQGFRYCGTLLDEPRQSLIDPQFESRIGVESGRGQCATLL
jgi:hypothetical protein